jgi:hypothetical protein
MTKEAAMTVTHLHIGSRVGGNGFPSSGTVQFSDGKEYSFGRDMEKMGDEWVFKGFFFSGYRKLFEGHHEHFSFHSPKRSDALLAYINSL